MRIKIKQLYTLTALTNLIDAVLLNTFNDDNIINIIRKVEHETVTETPKSKKPKEGYFIRKKNKEDSKPKETTYITKLVIEGYNSELGFVGTYNDNYCTKLIQMQDDNYNNFSIADMRKKWMALKKQMDGFGMKVIINKQDTKKVPTEKTTAEADN